MQCGYFIGVVDHVIVELISAYALHGRPVFVRHKNASGSAATDGNQHKEPVDIANAIAGADAVLQRCFEADIRGSYSYIFPALHDSWLFATIAIESASTSASLTGQLAHTPTHNSNLPLVAVAPVQRCLLRSIVQRNNGLLLGDAANTNESHISVCAEAAASAAFECVAPVFGCIIP